MSAPIFTATRRSDGKTISEPLVWMHNVWDDGCGSWFFMGKNPEWETLWPDCPRYTHSADNAQTFVAAFVEGLQWAINEDRPTLSDPHTDSYGVYEGDVRKDYEPGDDDDEYCDWMDYTITGWRETEEVIGEWKKVGVVGVDAGTLYLGDPCYVLQDGASHREEGAQWAERLTENNFEPTQLNYRMGHAGLGVLVGTGYGDGCYDVEVKRTEDGRVAAVRVVFI